MVEEIDFLLNWEIKLHNKEKFSRKNMQLRMVKDVNRLQAENIHRAKKKLKKDKMLNFINNQSIDKIMNYQVCSVIELVLTIVSTMIGKYKLAIIQL